MTGTDATVKVMSLSDGVDETHNRGSRIEAKGGWTVERAYDEVTHPADCLVLLRSSLRVGGDSAGHEEEVEEHLFLNCAGRPSQANAA
jgi:hypothetical protein